MTNSGKSVPRQASVSISGCLQQIMKDKGVTEAELARGTGIPQATCNRIILGETEDPRASTLSAFAQFLGVTIGQIIGSEPLTPLAGSKAANPHLLAIPIIQWSQIKSWVFERKLLNPHSVESWISTERPLSPDSYALRSLPSLEPRFKASSLLIVDPHLKYEDGHFVIVAFDGINPTMRRVVVDGNRILFKALNKAIPMVECAPEHRVFGTVAEMRLNHY